MTKKYECSICGEKSCSFSVSDADKKPTGCPFDRKHDAIWKEDK